MASRTFTNKALTIRVDDLGDRYEVHWSGKSTARNPSQFIAPILTATMQAAEKNSRMVVLDFTRVEYMNSSTVTPVIRVLDEAKRKGLEVEVVYAADLKWQELSFSALRVFCDEGSSISILPGATG